MRGYKLLFHNIKKEVVIDIAEDAALYGLSDLSTAAKKYLQKQQDMFLETWASGPEYPDFSVNAEQSEFEKTKNDGKVLIRGKTILKKDRKYMLSLTIIQIPPLSRNQFVDGIGFANKGSRAFTKGVMGSEGSIYLNVKGEIISDDSMFFTFNKP